MRTALYVLLALAAPAFAGQTVYKWVDEKGVTHFSDQPVPGAEKVELSSGPKRSSSPEPAYIPPARSEPPANAPAYSRFVVARPQQDESIVNTGGKVTVQLTSSPGLASGHTVTLYLDGAPVPDFAPNGMNHEFSEMPRGAHTVKAVISDASGKKLQETPAVTFHVRQESVAQPPVGPAMRNPNNKPPRRTTGNKLRTTQPTYSALNGGKAQIDPRTNLPINTKPATPDKPAKPDKPARPAGPQK